MKDYHINIFYSEEDEGYIADIPDLKYCSAFGSTVEEAVREVLIAKATWLEAAASEGKPIPNPDIVLQSIRQHPNVTTNKTCVGRFQSLGFLLVRAGGLGLCSCDF